MAAAWTSTSTPSIAPARVFGSVTSPMTNSAPAGSRAPSRRTRARTGPDWTARRRKWPPTKPVGPVTRIMPASHSTFRPFRPFHHCSLGRQEIENQGRQLLRTLDRYGMPSPAYQLHACTRNPANDDFSRLRRAQRVEVGCHHQRRHHDPSEVRIEGLDIEPRHRFTGVAVPPRVGGGLAPDHPAVSDL